MKICLHLGTIGVGIGIGVAIAIISVLFDIDPDCDPDSDADSDGSWFTGIFGTGEWKFISGNDVTALTASWSILQYSSMV